MMNHGGGAAPFQNPKRGTHGAVFEFIEGWYNPHRRHSALDYLSPINYERCQQHKTFIASPTPSSEPG